MRILALSDIHGSTRQLGRLVERVSGFDLAVVAGDLTDFGGADEARSILAPLREISRILLAVSGNCDRSGVRSFLESEGLSVEGRSRTALGLTFAGAGGGLRHSGFTPHELSDDELEDSLRSAVLAAPGESLVILTHTPPNGTGLDRRNNRHVGSHAFRALLGEARPLAWISGHIHEARSLSRSGATLLLNPGPLNEGYYAVLEVREEGGGFAVEAELHSLR